jgi:hypothetical protein
MDDASQPLEDIVITKTHYKSWNQLCEIAMKNKIVVKTTMSFEGENMSGSFTYVPTVEHMKSVHSCIDPGDDDMVMQFNDFYFEMKEACNEKIQVRQAQAARHRVSELGSSVWLKTVREWNTEGSCRGARESVSALRKRFYMNARKAS